LQGEMILIWFKAIVCRQWFLQFHRVIL